MRRALLLPLVALSLSAGGPLRLMTFNLRFLSDHLPVLAEVELKD